MGALWQGSDVVARSVLLILAAFSAGSWYVIVTKALEQLRIGRPREARPRPRFWDAGTVQAGAGKLHEASPFRDIAEAGLDATRRHGGLHAKVDFNDWVDLTLHRATERVQRRLSVGLSFLATVGFDLAVRRPVRYGLGYLPRAHGHRPGRARPRSTRWRARWARR